MPKVLIKFEVYSEKGFSETVYSNQRMINTGERFFLKGRVQQVAHFIKHCMNEYNHGKRGNRWNNNEKCEL